MRIRLPHLRRPKIAIPADDRRMQLLPTCEKLIADVHRDIRAGILPPGTPLDVGDLQTRYASPPRSTDAAAAVQVLWQQGVLVCSLELGHCVLLVPTADSVHLKTALRDPQTPELVHLYRGERADEYGHVRPAQDSSLCGISIRSADGSGRTLDPAESTCPACLRAHAYGWHLTATAFSALPDLYRSIPR
jgi:hypothetical protein